MALSAGDKAPDFTLSTIGAGGPELFTLSEALKGNKVLLLFVPMAFTGVCTEELCSLSNGLDAYTELGATVVGISGDGPFAQKAWAEKEGIKLKLVSDYEHDTAKAYGVAYESFLPQVNLPMGGVAKRSAFIIDQSGTVQYAESNDDPKQLPDFDAIKAKLAEMA